MAACGTCGLIMPMKEIDEHVCEDPWNIVAELETENELLKAALHRITRDSFFSHGQEIRTKGSIIAEEILKEHYL